MLQMASPHPNLLNSLPLHHKYEVIPQLNKQQSIIGAINDAVRNMLLPSMLGAIKWLLR